MGRNKSDKWNRMEKTEKNIGKGGAKVILLYVSLSLSLSYYIVLQSVFLM